MHIGSSSRMPATSGDAPVAVAATLSFNNAMASLADWLFSGKLVKFPKLKIAYSEGQIGWLPYALERADDVWLEHRAWAGVQDIVPEAPSSYFKRQVYGCFFRDKHGLDSLDAIGVDNVTFETDYPHTDSTWPHTKKVAEEMMEGLSAEQVYKIVRGNAIKMLSLGIDIVESGGSRKRLVEGDERLRPVGSHQDPDHAERFGRPDVARVIVDEGCLVRGDAERVEGQLEDARVGLAYADRRGVDDDLEELVDRHHLAPAVTELGDVVGDQRGAQAALADLPRALDHRLAVGVGLVPSGRRAPGCRSRSPARGRVRPAPRGPARG